MNFFRNRLKIGAVLSLFVALTLGALSNSSRAASSSVCNSLLTPSLPQFADISENAIPGKFVAKAQALAEKYGVEDFDGKNYVDLVDQVYRNIGTQRNFMAIAGAEKMAKFGMELDELLVGVPKDVRQATWFNVGYAVNDLEGFKESELLPSVKNADKMAGLVGLDQYPSYAKGFVDSKPPYTNHVGWNTGSVLQIGEYRDVVSHNLWPLWLQPHDMLHVHFAYGHPKAVAVYFKATRSKNPKRFVMMAGMYEGVDTVQYTHEAALGLYFSKTMKMGLEDSMLWIGKASDAELDRVISEAGIDISTFVSDLDGWAPKTKVGFKGKTDEELDQEILAFVRKSEKDLSNPAKAKYTNYHRLASETHGSDWDKDFAHYNTMDDLAGPTASRPRLPTDHRFSLDWVAPSRR